MTEIEKTIDTILFLVGVLDIPTEKEVGEKFKQLVKLVREDQERITRQSCAVSAAKVKSIPFVSMNPNIDHVIKEDIFQAIKNTKTIED